MLGEIVLPSVVAILAGIVAYEVFNLRTWELAQPIGPTSGTLMQRVGQFGQTLCRMYLMLLTLTIPLFLVAAYTTWRAGLPEPVQSTILLMSIASVAVMVIPARWVALRQFPNILVALQFQAATAAATLALLWTRPSTELEGMRLLTDELFKGSTGNGLLMTLLLLPLLLFLIGELSIFALTELRPEQSCPVRLRRDNSSRCVVGTGIGRRALTATLVNMIKRACCPASGQSQSTAQGYVFRWVTLSFTPEVAAAVLAGCACLTESAVKFDDVFRLARLWVRVKSEQYRLTNSSAPASRKPKAVNEQALATIQQWPQVSGAQLSSGLAVTFGAPVATAFVEGLTLARECVRIVAVRHDTVPLIRFVTGVHAVHAPWDNCRTLTIGAEHGAVSIGFMIDASRVAPSAICQHLLSSHELAEAIEEFDRVWTSCAQQMPKAVN